MGEKSRVEKPTLLLLQCQQHGRETYSCLLKLDNWMAPGGRLILSFCYGAVFLLASQVLASRSSLVSPTADPNLHPQTTTEIGFFKKMFQAAQGLVWKDSSNASAPSPSPAFPSLATPGTPAQVQFVKAAQPKDVAAKMNFSLRVLNGDMSATLEPEVYIEGSAIYLEAKVQAGSDVSPKLFIDECYGADAQPRSHSRKIYIIADNHGCLYSGSSEVTWFRKENSVMVLKVPAFLLTGPSDEIYIHCLLKAWSQKRPSSPGKKACYFDNTSSRWENTDEPSKTSICECCASHCSSEPLPLEKDEAFWGEGRIHKEVAGPLVVHKQDAPWFEGQCRTMKKMVLVSVAFVSSSILAALFVGALVALVLAVLRHSHVFQGHRRLKDKREQDFHTELQAVVGALAAADEMEEKETNLDYCKLKSDDPEKV